MLSPTGHSIVLEHGATRAEIGTVAAVLRGLSIDGFALTEPTPVEASPAFANGIVLAPWPNRVRDGRWRLEGRDHQLDISEPARRNAIHGLLRFADYQVRSRAADEVTLAALIAPQHGWPFVLDTRVSYRVTDDGLAVTHTVVNHSPTRAPWAVGTHPFLRLGDTPVDELSIVAHAASYIDVDERLNPIATRAVDATRFELREPRPIAELDLDTAYGSLTPAPLDGTEGGETAALTDAAGNRLSLWQGPDWRYLQVFTTREFPRDGVLGTAVAVEPMTAPPDALNSGEGLSWLEPGAEWSGSWGLRFTPAAR